MRQYWAVNAEWRDGNEGRRTSRTIYNSHVKADKACEALKKRGLGDVLPLFVWVDKLERMPPAPPWGDDAIPMFQCPCQAGLCGHEDPHPWGSTWCNTSPFGHPACIQVGWRENPRPPCGPVMCPAGEHLPGRCDCALVARIRGGE